MSSKAMSLKAKIRNLAKEKGITAQVIMQNYMFERFLERVSLSEYRDKFIIKGGILIAAIVGLDTRATMDLDATIRAYPLDEEHLRAAIEQICSVAIEDDIGFRLIEILPIRKNDEYGGFRASLESAYDSITTPLSVDITSGDVLTPGAVKHSFRGIFDEDKRIELWAYNIETVLAEKVETILRRGVFSTRPRDYYDVYILAKTQRYDAAVFQKALDATAKHRETAALIKDVPQIIDAISHSVELKANWEKYSQEYAYSADINYDDIIEVLSKLAST